MSSTLRKALALSLMVLVAGAYLVSAPIQQAQAVGVLAACLIYLAGALTAIAATWWWMVSHQEVAEAGVYEPGVTVNSYLENYGYTVETQLGAVELMIEDAAELTPSTVYYFARKAEYVAQMFINETEFPADRVLVESGVYGELANITSVYLLRLDDLLNVFDNTVDSWTEGVLADATVRADTEVHTSDLDLKNYEAEAAVYVLHGKCPYANPGGEGFADLELKLYALDGTAITIDSGGSGLYYANLTVSDALEGTVMDELSGSGSVTLSEGLYNIKFHAEGHSNSGSWWIRLKVLGGAYIIDEQYTHSAYNYPPPCSNSYVVSVDYSKVVSFKFSNGTAQVYSFTLDELHQAFQYLKSEVDSMLDTVLSCAQSEWQYLRNLNYTDYNDVPPELLTLLPDFALPPSDLLSQLSQEDVYAIFTAWMKSIEQHFNETNYEEADDFGPDDTLFTDIMLKIINATIYDAAGQLAYNLTGWLTMLLPTIEDIQLRVGELTNLTSGVYAILYNPSNNTVKYVHLPANWGIVPGALTYEGEPVSEGTYEAMTLEQFYEDWLSEGPPPAQTTPTASTGGGLSEGKLMWIVGGMLFLMLLFMAISGGGGSGVVVVGGRRR